MKILGLLNMALMLHATAAVAENISSGHVLSAQDSDLEKRNGRYEDLELAASKIDWGVFPVPVDERDFRCNENNSSSKSLEFFLMPRLISKNEFRANDSGIKLEQHFAYYFTDKEDEHTCEYKRRLLKIAEDNGGYLRVRLITYDASRRKFTTISEYGVTRCIEETREKLRVEFPIGIATISDEREIRTLHYGKCEQVEDSSPMPFIEGT